LKDRDHHSVSRESLADVRKQSFEILNEACFITEYRQNSSLKQPSEHTLHHSDVTESEDEEFLNLPQRRDALLEEVKRLKTKEIKDLFKEG